VAPSYPKACGRRRRYEDDKDEGEWFLYTGSGGRDLSGNKRTNKARPRDDPALRLMTSDNARRLHCGPVFGQQQAHVMQREYQRGSAGSANVCFAGFSRSKSSRRHGTCRSKARTRRSRA